MSVVADLVRRWEADVERVSLLPLSESDDEEVSAETSSVDSGSLNIAALSSPRVNELLHIVRSLSSSSSSSPLLSSYQVQSLLKQSGLAASADDVQGLEQKSSYESEIEWLLVSKATVQTYGIIMNTLLDQIIPLSDDIWYWDEVLGSYSYSSIYAVQTAPLRMWDWTKDILGESRSRFRQLRESPTETLNSGRATLSRQWSEFYGIVRRTVAERSIKDIQRRMLSPVAICRSQARHKQKQLKQLRMLIASGLGTLIDEGLGFDEGHGSGKEIKANDNGQKWKGIVERSVILMDMVLYEVLQVDYEVREFEDKIFNGVEEDPELSIHHEDENGLRKPAILAKRLLKLLETRIPEHVRDTKVVVSQYGRPSALVRYWLPITVLVLSSSTLLRIVVNRQDDILNWVRNLGATVRDFWFNWVVEPIRKVIGTIRHDENSEIAIMSRDSLKADRESLERMVVEFARDKPLHAVGEANITDAQLSEIQAKVREGDVTPVLRAYENDLRKPFVGAVRGDLVRSLLIQVQKTKVDLEVAMSGIDSLLKSQELVFGFVGLTPGVLVSIGVFQYLRGVLGGRKGVRRGQKATRAMRVLRNIDRIFYEVNATADPQKPPLLSYKDHGLLVCEVHILRELAHGLMPREIEKEFLEDLDDLVANTKGIQLQMMAFERIRWAYSKWLR
ncbi:uncharacterized protein E0L32_008593 [Thyridium curvatum]|uniref:ATP synthase regulation protein NCA2 n=1 Tax=Thyridium curvatum TaxID=1093900 RepID=A0A507ARV7_9PEZI|nr:uncharacterized protein E0L32_008593 [Thyridium curvatum]TPX10543.1 hypothetical protein E0L32_008593 [Thyridium curvatum]